MLSHRSDSASGSRVSGRAGRLQSGVCRNGSEWIRMYAGPRYACRGGCQNPEGSVLCRTWVFANSLRLLKEGFRLVAVKDGTAGSIMPAVQQEQFWKGLQPAQSSPLPASGSCSSAQSPPASQQEAAGALCEATPQTGCPTRNSISTMSMDVRNFKPCEDTLLRCARNDAGLFEVAARLLLQHPQRYYIPCMILQLYKVAARYRQFQEYCCN